MRITRIKSVSVIPPVQRNYKKIRDQNEHLRKTLLEALREYEKGWSLSIYDETGVITQSKLSVMIHTLCDNHGVNRKVTLRTRGAKTVQVWFL